MLTFVREKKASTLDAEKNSRQKQTITKSFTDGRLLNELIEDDHVITIIT